MARREDESSTDQALRIAASADRGLLAIQGPPGTGKTWTGSQIIADKIAGASSAGRPFTVCITANGHRVIRHLMLEVMKRCAEQGLTATFAHVGGQDKVDAAPGIASLKDSKDLAPWVNHARAEGKVVVVGATKYALARPDAALIADLIVVDEASQYSLTDACAVAQAAPMVVALGDPQQLPSPVQASHDESVAMSLLEHVADGSPVIPEGAGVFLDRSHRLHPAICSVVADLSYEGRLTWSDEAASRTISGASALVAGQTVEVRPGVSWVPLSDGHDEAQVVRELLEQMVGKTLVVKEDGSQEPLTWDEVRVVAPHNAHVNRLIAALPAEARVGTVDRFQGQEGHVVVYSMGRLADNSREVSFLYDTNRLNVALSRARLLAIVVSHEDAVFPPVSNPEQLKAVSHFIRAVTER